MMVTIRAKHVTFVRTRCMLNEIYTSMYNLQVTAGTLSLRPIGAATSVHLIIRRICYFCLFHPSIHPSIHTYTELAQRGIALQKIYVLLLLLLYMCTTRQALYHVKCQLPLTTRLLPLPQHHPPLRPSHPHASSPSHNIIPPSVPPTPLPLSLREFYC